MLHITAQCQYVYVLCMYILCKYASHSIFMGHGKVTADDLPAQKKDGDRGKGKGRRVCLGGRIYSIPCRPSCFTLVDLEEKVDFILLFQIDGGKTAGAAWN